MTSKPKQSSTEQTNIYYDPNKEVIDNGKISDEQMLLDSCPYAMIIASVQGKILALNDAAADIFKKPRKELIGSSGYSFVELDAGERRRQVIHRIMEQKKPQLLEDYERGIWWRTLFQPVQDKNGNVIKFAVMIHNISAEKSREKDFAEKNEEFWRRLIQYSNNSFFIVDEQGVIRYVSESIKPIMGYNPQDVIGTNIFDYFFDEDREKAHDFFEKVLQTKYLLYLSHRILSKKGKIRYMETTVNNLIENPIVRGIIITTRDITKTHKAQIETQETKKYLENIINSTSEIIFTLDTNGKVTLWNERAAFVTGFTQKSIVGKKIFSVLNIKDDVSFKSYMQRCSRNISKPCDLKIQTKHGDSRLLRVQGSPVKTDDKKIKGVVFTGRDITSDAQIHGHLVKGASYLILDESNSKAIDLLNGLLLDDYTGLIITRGISQKLHDTSLISLPVTHYYFSQQISSPDDTSALVSDLSKLTAIISDFFSTMDQSIVLIDRLDYLIALHGFNKVMQTVYTLSSVASKKDGIVLIRLNPAVISKTDLAILKEELKNLPEQSVENITIDNKLFNILQFVEKKNAHKSLVSFKNVGKQFSITKVTTAKRINNLEGKDLVAIKKRGRLKTIHITDKGRRLLQRRNVV